MNKVKLVLAVSILLIIGSSIFGFFYFSSKSHTSVTTLSDTQRSKFANADKSDAGIVIDLGHVVGAPYIKTKFGVSNNIASLGLMESLEGTYLDDIGPGLLCTHVEFDYTIRHSDEEGLPPINPAYTTEIGKDGQETLSTKPSPWLAKFETLVNNKNIPLLMQLSGGPAPYQVDKISKPAEHPAPTDGPTFKSSANIIGTWTAASNHISPVLWSVWHEPEHTLVGVARSKNIAGDFISPYSEENPEPKALFEVRNSKSRTDSMSILNAIYRAYFATMKPVMSPYSHYGLAGFLAGSVEADTVSPGKTKQLSEPLLATFLNEHTTRNKEVVVPIQFLSFDSYNGRWQSITQGTRAILKTRTDIGPIIYNEYAPSIMKFAEDGDNDPTTNSKMAIKENHELKPGPLAASVAMLTDMYGLLDQPDVAHMCMSYWTGGTTGILFRPKGTTKLTPTLRYQTLLMYAALPVSRVPVTGKDIVPVGTPGLHAMAGLDWHRTGVLLFNDAPLGTKPVVTTLQFKNLPTNLQTGTIKATIETITKDTDITSQKLVYEGQELTIAPQTIAFIRIENDTPVAPLERRHSLTSETTKRVPQFLTTMPMIDRTETTCSGKICTMPALHYAVYDSVRSVAHLGTATVGKDATTAVTYKNLPDQLYVNAIVHNIQNLSELISIDVAFAGCPTHTSIPIKQANATTAIDLVTTGSACKWETQKRTATLTFMLKGKIPLAQAELYLSANKKEADAIAVASK